MALTIISAWLLIGVVNLAINHGDAEELVEEWNGFGILPVGFYWFGFVFICIVLAPGVLVYDSIPMVFRYIKEWIINSRGDKQE